jgi:hypothetical protein
VVLPDPDGQLKIELFEHRYHFGAALVLLGHATQPRDDRIGLVAFHCRHDVSL